MGVYDVAHFFREILGDHHDSDICSVEKSLQSFLDFLIFRFVVANLKKKSEKSLKFEDRIKGPVTLNRFFLEIFSYFS